ncbi:unnamed protein product [Oncorhynchus mykiss]|uniref:Uncharacterized protein n=1 Tax=Oncorhynchus mykiss TaxID=8022 RepID=A0A060Z6L8_ONCMY|nr:unnamed protein product [Oncorhynchus mykiss]
MNSAVVIFLDSIEKVNTIVESDTDVCIPSYESGEESSTFLTGHHVLEMKCWSKSSPHGQLVSAIKKVTFGCKSPDVSHRRQVHMILKEDTDKLNLAFTPPISKKLKLDGFDYVFYASTE